MQTGRVEMKAGSSVLLIEQDRGFTLVMHSGQAPGIHLCIYKANGIDGGVQAGKSVTRVLKKFSFGKEVIC